jgi:hypothetical protein
MTEMQSRQAAGIPAGGQFTGQIYNEAVISLEISDEEYNRTGTFLFPPATRSAAQHIAFWETCEIDDSVLENISLGYEKWAHDWQDGQVRKWLMDVYYPSVRLDKWKGNDNQLSHAQIAARESAAAEYAKTQLDPIHPKKISSVDARNVARAGQLFFYSSDLTEEDRAAVDASMIPFRHGPVSVEDTVTRFNLIRMRPFFAGQTRALVESLDQIRVEASFRNS